MLFVVFDVETMFLIPWAILYRGWVMTHMGLFALVSMFVFLGILLIGYVWLYKKGALEWA
jgi:NADH-quinone oxidoreductase subunit A